MSTRLAFVLLAACGGSSATSPVKPPDSTQPPIATPVTNPVIAPAVTVAGVTATDDGAPPVVVMIDAQGQRRLASAASWKDVGLGAWTAGPKIASNEASHRELLEGTVLGKSPRQIVEGFANYDVGTRGGANDDPPPPEEESDESGGTGTAMALEEGKMGRKPGAPVGPWRGPIYGDKERYAEIVGEVSNAKLERVPSIVIPAPATKAQVVVAAVTELEAMIGVWSSGELHPLRIQFHRDRDHDREDAGRWLDLEVAAALTIDGKPVEIGAIKSAIDDGKQRHKLPANAAIDVLVGPEVDAQRLVDVLVALDRAGVVSIGLGLVPTEAQRKANLPPVVTTGQPNSQGDLDKKVIREYVLKSLDKIRYCYEKELLAKPGLQGTVLVQFFITPNGNVAAASGSGVDGEVATCVAAVIKMIEFPKPKGGGGVQVNYPFTFRPEGANPKKK